MIIPSKHCGYGEGGRLTSTRRVYDSGSTSPTSQTVTQTTIPEYARPYVEATLGRAWPMIEQPMQQYQGERYAQFSPLQQQVFEGAEQLQAAPQMQTASDIAAQAAQTGLGYGGYKPFAYAPESFTGTSSQVDAMGKPISTASQYMNPYMQQVLAPQLQAMQRQADIQRNMLGAQAAQAGAFGGARAVLGNQQLNAELMRQQQQATGQAYGQAYGQAQQQFNQEQAARMQAAQMGEQSRQYGAGLGLQGLSAALQGAGQLGQLGQGQFGQNVQALGLQSQLGAQQQQQMQNILSGQYQDWLNYQNYPYKQLGFMSDILRGMPLTQQAQTIYQGPGSMLGQIAGLGLGAYGALSKAEGGMIDQEEGMVGNEGVAKLDDGTLQQEYIKAVRSNNEPRANAIKAELQYRSQRFNKYKGMADGGMAMDPGTTPSYQRTSTAPGMLDFAQHSEPVVRMAAGGPYPQSVTSEQNVEGILDRLSDAQLKQARQIAVAERDLERVQMIDREMAQRASERSGLGAAFNMSPMGQQPAEEGMARGGIVAFAEGGSDELRSAIEGAEAEGRAQDLPIPQNSLLGRYRQMTGEMRDPLTETESRTISDIIGKLSTVERPSDKEMMIRSGLAMARAASKPGARFLGAATEGLGEYANIQEQYRKEAKDAQKLGAQLTIEKIKLDAANRRGARQEAMTAAKNIADIEQKQAELQDISEYRKGQLQHGMAQVEATRYGADLRYQADMAQVAAMRARDQLSKAGLLDDRAYKLYQMAEKEFNDVRTDIDRIKTKDPNFAKAQQAIKAYNMMTEGGKKPNAASPQVKAMYNDAMEALYGKGGTEETPTGGYFKEFSDRIETAKRMAADAGTRYKNISGQAEIPSTQTAATSRPPLSGFQR